MSSSRNTDVKDCKHQSGVMIPQQDLDSNYVKPEFMICTNCRFVTDKIFGVKPI